MSNSIGGIEDVPGETMKTWLVVLLVLTIMFLFVMCVG